MASIKDGQDLPFDSEFVISEVNADIKYYYEVEKDKFEMSGANATKVGMFSKGGEKREGQSEGARKGEEQEPTPV